MEYKIFLEWNNECGIFFSNMSPLSEGIEEAFETLSYGNSIKSIGVVLVCRPYDFKQRKQFKKDAFSFEYDILLDYFLIKSVEMEEKKEIIRKQIMEITEQTFSKYKFEDFDKTAFLSDLKGMITSILW